MLDQFNRFKSDVSQISSPENFTFPFYYEPHDLARIAAEELQDYLEYQFASEHNFGLDPEAMEGAIGKMFGVLVVENQEKERGFLCAFSGKIANENHHQYFVPPVFDILDTAGFFRKGEDIILAINAEINALKVSPLIVDAEEALKRFISESEAEIKEVKRQNKQNKMERDRERILFEALEDADRKAEELEILRKKSIHDSYQLKKLQQHVKDTTAKLQAELLLKKERLDFLLEDRKKKSADLQNQIFAHYQFLNALLEPKSLLSIFQEELDMQPPAGAGECAAPKLLHFAYQNSYKPLALAEFWWGASPGSEIRIHKNYYPACRSKCEPILGHMLQGLQIDENPLLSQVGADFEALDLLFEDEHMLAINKPAEFLSVPGINIKDSVYERVLRKYPEATGPLIVHRLDMSTSGILLLAKTKEAYLKLQRQFLKRTIKKRYVALLDGVIKEPSGTIDLPLRVDLDDRPRQMVCYEHGKRALTNYEVISIENGKTKVYFYPITGRTHQLRVHAAHELGLGTPIVGDDLYGKKSNRLHLHAEWIEFRHPSTNEVITLQVDPNF